MKTIYKVLIWVFGSSIIVGGGFWTLFMNHISLNQAGIVYDAWNGTYYVQETPGFYLTNPLTLVARVPTVPIRVEIPSEAKIIVAKMVRFNTKGIDEYINVQGFSYDMGGSLENILLGYVFSGENYSFLEIVEDVQKRTTSVESKQNTYEKKDSIK